MERRNQFIKRDNPLDTGKIGVARLGLAVGLCGLLAVRCAPPEGTPTGPPPEVWLPEARAAWRPTSPDLSEPGALTRAVSRRLELDRRTANLALNVDVFEGRIVLNGAVPTSGARELAQHLVADVPGVEQVDDHTVVGLGLKAEPHPVQWTDTDIEAALSDVLRLSRRLVGHPLRGRSRGGVVHLTGIVPSEGIRTYAEEIVRQVPGVVAVRNSVSVQPPLRGT